ncbi:MAG: CvpA family protein [candidate division Zixibacteria bacterium]|nr:CvpA family protein [candidate division Zixibacteria bacterium]
MNWVDIVLLILLVASLVVGSKKGLIRELMALLVLTTAVILSVNYIDLIAVKVYEQLGGSPLVTAIISFVLLLAFIYAIFKLMAIMFYKFANMQKLGKKDQLGGALVGFVRGWVVISFCVFVVFLMPMPERFYLDFEESFLGPTFAKTLPVLYEGSAGLHPENPEFMPKIETALLQRPSGTMSQEDRLKLSNSREQVYRVIYQMDRFFGSRQ